MSSKSYQYKRVLQFYETDAMGIIHHANYILLMEEARLQFLRILHDNAEGNYLEEVNYPLMSCEVQYKRPMKFNEEVVIDYQVSTRGQRLVFDYQLSTKSFDKPVAFGKTVHAALNMETQRPTKLPDKLVEFIHQ